MSGSVLRIGSAKYLDVEVMLVGDRGRVIACFHEAGFQMDKDQFEHRLIAQKMVYLLRLKGAKFAYPYNLYVRGPYSPLLAGEYYRHADEFAQLKTDVDLTSTEVEFVEELTCLFDKSPSLLEVGATYAYLAFSTRYPPTHAYRLVKRMKSFYPNETIVKGVNRAKQYLFVPSEVELRDLEPELRAWQQASIASMRH